jgi:hypothetical protein
LEQSQADAQPSGLEQSQADAKPSGLEEGQEEEDWQEPAGKKKAQKEKATEVVLPEQQHGG